MRFVRVNATSDGDNEVIAASAVGADKRIRVINYAINVNAAGVVTIQTTESSPTILASFEFVDGGGASFPGTFDSPAFDLPLGVGLEVSNAAGVDTLGHLAYEIV